MATTHTLAGGAKDGSAFAFTSERQYAFLALIADCHSITAACRIVGIERSTAYNHYNADPLFALAWEDAINARGDWWEDRLRQLGDQKKPDTLATIVGLKKEKRFIEPQYAAKLQVQVVVDARPYAKLSMEELRQRLAQAEAEALKAEVGARTIEVKALSEGSDATDV